MFCSHYVKIQTYLLQHDTIPSFETNCEFSLIKHYFGNEDKMLPDL